MYYYLLWDHLICGSFFLVLRVSVRKKKRLHLQIYMKPRQKDDIFLLIVIIVPVCCTPS